MSVTLIKHLGCEMESLALLVVETQLCKQRAGRAYYGVYGLVKDAVWQRLPWVIFYYQDQQDFMKTASL